MKTTRKEISKWSKLTKIRGSNRCNYKYELSSNLYYTKEHEYINYNEGRYYYTLGTGTTKRQFVELVYNHINTKNVKS